MAKRKPELIDPDFVRAIGHPLRVELLDVLAGRTASPNDLAEVMAMPLSNVAYHVRILSDCGTLDLIKERQRRGATEHFYRAKPEAFIGGRQWRRVPRSIRAGGVSAPVIQSFFDKVIRALESGAIDARDDSTLSYMTVAVDEQGWKELVRMRERFLNLAIAVHDRSAKRLGGVDGIPVVLGLAAFEPAPVQGRAR